MAQIRIAYSSLPIHQGFHRTRAREKCAMGAVGSGKTLALCGDAIDHGLRLPGSRILVARNTIPSLRDTTETEFISMLSAPPNEDDYDAQTFYDLCTVYRLGGHVDRIIDPFGTEYLFRSLDDWRKLMSLNLAGIYIDEASEVTVDAYNGLKTRLRQNQPTPMARKLGIRWQPSEIFQRIALATNPDGHNWIWEYFYHRPTSARRVFESTSFDNPTLYNADGTPGEYLQSLLDMPDVWVRRYVLCQHDSFSGQIFDFDPQRHVQSYFEPPSTWDRAMGLDWGIRNPTAIVWWARKPGTSKWYQYREWQTYDPMDPIARDSYVTMDVHEIAKTIQRIERGERIKYRAADPIIRNRVADGGKSVQTSLGEYGLHFQLGTKDYQNRITHLQAMLHRNELVFLDNCDMTQIQIQQYRWADLNVSKDRDGQERPHKKNDHLVDACQYLSTIFAQPSKIEIRRPAPKPHEEIWSIVKKKQQRISKRRKSRF